ncbi:sugar kinase [Falsiroseomonas sp.]|uniref:sugar kinase n=1 Tax=Falsiroseomonas sp. TaxID=2870721 RepID=UPI002728D3D8|nr:sugar kinase [Falsiroseomonas sp.]MDO9499988.1 sugar kinase [Falsiroseomonas sp.]MDP3419241.1 sugar kinase [Falsiroseomonas sp.]
MPDILCLGEPMLEYNQQPVGADGRSLYLEGHGGDVSNAAIAAARSGADAGMIAHMGRDRPGESFAQLWALEGVDASSVRVDPDAPTGIYFVSHGPQGHDFTFYRRGSAASRMRVADVPEEAIQGARILHLSGISLGISDTACDAAFHAIQVARKAGVTVSFDTNLRLRLWPLRRASACIHTAVGMSDLVFPSLDDARLLTGLVEPEAIVDFYLKLCPLVLLKLGAAGLLVASREARAQIPGFAVRAVDATGAGDTLAGAFLARAVAGDDTWQAARYANAAAALSTTGYGAVAPIPTAAEVHAFLEVNRS